LQSNSHAAGTAQPASDVQALLDQRTCRRIIALLSCEHACSEEHTSPRVRTCCSAFKFEKFPQTVAAFGQMLTHIPELEERGPKAQPPIGIASERQPFHGSAKIIVFYQFWDMREQIGRAHV